MSLFEDLVEELKQDNLLEETIIDSLSTNDSINVAFKKEESVLENQNSLTEAVVRENNDSKKLEFEEDSNVINNDLTQIEVETAVSPETVEFRETVNVIEENELDLNFVEEVDETNLEAVNTFESKVTPVTNQVKSKEDELDFYRRRALDEVNGLQMVEHVLTSVEREQMKIVSKSYDDLEVKQSLQEFLQLTEDIKSPQHAQAEFRLMQETENWYSALSLRDRNISVSHLRRFCESTKPSLSSQALISLARFYRNSPYSETVRSKFDLVVSKLLTKEVGNEQRELIFKADELIEHIHELYAEWSSVPLYSTDEDDSELLIAALKFQDFIDEAEKAESFDELIKKDFFKRLKVFKEKTNENFFSPLLVAAAIECNVAVGNKYVELLEQEKENSSVSNLANKYGIIHDKSISEATSKTLELLEILKERKSESNDSPDNAENSNVEQNEKHSSANISKLSEKSLFSANKYLVITTIVVVLVAAVFFLVGGYSVIDKNKNEVSKDVKVVDLENSTLKEYVNSARINQSTLFAITTDAWNDKSLAEKEEIVNKFLSTGKDKGYSKVHFLNNKGTSVAFASAEGINIVE